MKDPGIIRNRLKIDAFIANARAYLKIRRSRGVRRLSLAVHRRQGFCAAGPPAPASRALERPERSDGRDLKKRGFRFVGSDDLLRLHAGGRHGRRTSESLLGGERRAEAAAAVRRCAQRGCFRAAPIGMTLFAQDRDGTSSSRCSLRMRARAASAHGRSAPRAAAASRTWPRLSRCANRVSRADVP